MKNDLLALLACPVCKRNFNLVNSSTDNDEVISGELVCSECNRRYQVSDGVPDLRPPPIEAGDKSRSSR